MKIGPGAMTSQLDTSDGAPRLAKHERDDSAVDVSDVIEAIRELYADAIAATELPGPCRPTPAPAPESIEPPVITCDFSIDVSELKIPPYKLRSDGTTDRPGTPVPSSVFANLKIPHYRPRSENTAVSSVAPSSSPQPPASSSPPPPPPTTQPQPAPPPHIRFLDSSPPPESPKPKSKSFTSILTSLQKATRSLLLRQSILHNNENLLVTDPAAVDALLTCICAISEARRKMIRLNLLPGCPVSRKKVRSTVNSLPALTTLFAAAAGPSSSDARSPEPWSKLSKRHRKLLTWVLSSPFCTLSSIDVKPNPSISLPCLLPLGIRAFAVTRHSPEKEEEFKKHCTVAPPFPVFHGTCPTRIPLILTHGLRNMSGTRYQAHGKALGPGIYLASDAATSLGYSYATPSWKNSAWNTPPLIPDTTYQSTGLYSTGQCDGGEFAARVLLGCELAGEIRGRGTYVVKEEGKVVVRFLFLVPGGWDGTGGEGLGWEMERCFGALKEVKAV